jgi:predicted heme/steroid binding protein
MNIRLISTISVVLLVIVVFAGIVSIEKLSVNPTSVPQSTNNNEVNKAEDVDLNKVSEPNAEKVVTESELANADGKNDNQCYVVVDNIVYSISGFVLWADGIHSPSGGRARCGKDLSSVINQSPHGKSKLNLLQKIGVYQN